MKYLIDGCYGDGNVGDEALLRSTCDLIRMSDPSAEIRVLSSDPDATSRQHEISCVRRVNPIGLSVYGAVAKGQLWRICDSIRWCDRFILGGGELLRDDVGIRSTVGMFYPLLLAHVCRKEILALGVGAQAPTTQMGRMLLRKVLTVCNQVVFRDPESAAVCRTLCPPLDHATWCSDMVFAMQGGNARITDTVCQKARPHVVAVAIKKLPERIMHAKEQTRVAQLIISALESLAATCHLSVRCLAFAESDVLGNRLVADSLRERGITVSEDNSLNLHSLRKNLESSSFSIAMPLHASVLSLGVGTPAIGLAYDAKVRKLFRHLGYDRFCIPCGTLLGENALKSAITALLAEIEVLRPGIFARIEQERENVRKLIVTQLQRTAVGFDRFKEGPRPIVSVSTRACG